MRSVVISSGHGLKIRGAADILDEVDEARRVVDRVHELLTAAGVNVKKFHDNVSTSQNENLNRIVDFHNSQPDHDLDVSQHFNAYEHTSKPMGTEVLYVTQSTLASNLSAALAAEQKLPNRGGKKRTDLFFLNNTHAPAILIEHCFVDSSADAAAYEASFEDACRVIAEHIADISLDEESPEPPHPERPPITDLPERPPERPEPPSWPSAAKRPMLMVGSRGEQVGLVQQCLRVTPVDGLFGSMTERAVEEFQAQERLAVDGIIGPDTWAALDSIHDLPPYVPKTVLSPKEIEEICDIAIGSEIADYAWRDRGVAPDGYIKGMAIAYAQAYRLYRQDVVPFLEMGKANTGDDDDDVLAYCEQEFDDLGMSNDVDGTETLRHLYTFLIGLGMRESSGQHCEGRDMSASNTSSDTAEAGLFQTSWNAHTCHDACDELFDEYYADSTLGYMNIFEEDVSCSSSSWSCYGSGDGAMFQHMAKYQPTFAVEFCGVTLRHLRNHYGPVNRGEVEIRTDADEMLQEVESVLNRVA
jgi:hypothetical protein